MKGEGFAILKGIVLGDSLGLLAGILFAPRFGKGIRTGMERRAEKTIGEIIKICPDTEMKAKGLPGGTGKSAHVLPSCGLKLSFNLPSVLDLPNNPFTSRALHPIFLRTGHTSARMGSGQSKSSNGAQKTILNDLFQKPSR